LTILIIGAGSIGQRHLINIKKIKRKEEIILVEKNNLVRKRISDEHSITSYSTIEKALIKHNISSAFICTPSNMHLKQLKTLIKAKCHIFIEKPLSLNFSEIKKIEKKILGYRYLIMVACNLRFHPGVLKLKKYVDDNMIGKIYYARSQFSHYLPNWRANKNYKKFYSSNSNEGGGIILDAIHEPDYLYWIFGDIKLVSAFSNNISELNIDVEDVAEYTLFHKKNVYSHVHVDYLRRDKIRSCEIIGTKGTISWESKGKNPENIKIKMFNQETQKTKILFKSKNYDLNKTYILQLKHFFDCIDSGRKNMNNFKEASKLINVMDKIKLSSITKKFVKV